MDIFGVLSDGYRVLVLPDRDSNAIFTWNNVHTLQRYVQYQPSQWMETEIRTLSIMPKSFLEAKKEAMVFRDYFNEENDRN